MAREAGLPDSASLHPSYAGLTLLRRSAIRVCQPGPVAFHRAITSSGRRREISFRGFKILGRPPFLTLARASISFVSSGNPCTRSVE